MNLTTVAIDLAKTTFEVPISQEPGHIQQRCRLVVTPVRWTTQK